MIRSAIAVLGLAYLLVTSAQARELRVCADPNNLPFSNAQLQGFENKIVELLAKELGASLSYVWWPQRRGFIRNTLNTGSCDLIPGIASGIDMLRTTRPYYRSGYVFVSPAEGPDVKSLDDPLLRSLRVGVQLVGEDGSSTPPGHALARRGIIENVRGYSIYGDYSRQNPGAGIITALESGAIDIALVWGPLAGYLTKKKPTQFRLRPVRPEIDGPRLPMVFDIAMGVRLEDQALRDEINGVLIRLQPQIDAILAEYGVPRLDGAAQRKGAVAARPKLD